MINELKPQSGDSERSEQTGSALVACPTKTLKLVSVQTYATDPNRAKELVSVRSDEPEHAPRKDDESDDDDASDDE